MARTYAAAAVALMLLCTTAHAQTEATLPFVRFEEGAYPFHDDDQNRWNARGAAGAVPISHLGQDAFRFTFDASSALVKSYVFEASRHRTDATFSVTWLDRSRHGGWEPTRRERWRISLDEYGYLIAEIDEQLQRGRAYSLRLDAGEESWICNDGFSMLTERIADGRESWMAESCGPNHPNHLIERLLRDFALDRLGDRASSRAASLGGD